MVVSSVMWKFSLLLIFIIVAAVFVWWLSSSDPNASPAPPAVITPSTATPNPAGGMVVHALRIAEQDISHDYDRDD